MPIAARISARAVGKKVEPDEIPWHTESREPLGKEADGSYY
jgi:hypothetical protein